MNIEKSWTLFVSTSDWNENEKKIRSAVDAGICVVGFSTKGAPRGKDKPFVDFISEIGSKIFWSTPKHTPIGHPSKTEGDGLEKAIVAITGNHFFHGPFFKVWNSVSRFGPQKGIYTINTLPLMTPSKAQHIFSEIIWRAELSNLTLSEYLDTYPSENETWIETEAACEEAGICLWSVQTK